MTKLTGQCLCGKVSYEANGDIVMQGNCHCSDCRQSSGSPYATLVFMRQADVSISGEVQSFDHVVDSGNTLTKQFCGTCGSQMFGKNAARQTSLAIKAGTINEQEQVAPQFNVFVSGKMDCTILDDTIQAFDKMPG